jgi:hypothetical protein
MQWQSSRGSLGDMTKTAQTRPSRPITAAIDNSELREHYIFAINYAIETGHEEWVSDLANQYEAEMAASEPVGSHR